MVLSPLPPEVTSYLEGSVEVCGALLQRERRWTGPPSLFSSCDKCGDKAEGQHGVQSSQTPLPCRVCLAICFAFHLNQMTSPGQCQALDNRKPLWGLVLVRDPLSRDIYWNFQEEPSVIRTLSADPLWANTYPAFPARCQGTGKLQPHQCPGVRLTSSRSKWPEKCSGV